MEPASEVSSSAKTQAIRYCSLAKFHRHLKIPATSEHEELRITYSLVGASVDDEDPASWNEISQPTILWCGAMFGGRWQGLAVHNMAKRMGVRVCFVDRPGLGGSTRVDLKLRINIWLEIVPLLLTSLGVRHVALASHSAGTLYLLNTLFHLRYILSPRRPYVAMFAPWVHQEHSKVAALQLAGRLPSQAVDHWDKIMTFMATTVMPAFASSADVVAFSASISAKFIAPSQDSVNKQQKIEEGYGMDQKMYQEVQKLAMMYVFAEDTNGANEDAKLCLKTAGPGHWGVCEDYADYVTSLVEQERLLQSEEQEHSSDTHGSSNGKSLKVAVFFAETDALIGKKGRQYFESCWSDEKCEGIINFEAIATKGTNHETIWEPWRGPMEKLFEEAKQSLEAI